MTQRSTFVVVLLCLVFQICAIRGYAAETDSEFARFEKLNTSEVILLPPVAYPSGWCSTMVTYHGQTWQLGDLGFNSMAHEEAESVLKRRGYQVTTMNRVEGADAETIISGHTDSAAFSKLSPDSVQLVLLLNLQNISAKNLCGRTPSMPGFRGKDLVILPSGGNSVEGAEAVVTIYVYIWDRISRTLLWTDFETVSNQDFMSDVKYVTGGSVYSVTGELIKRIPQTLPAKENVKIRRRQENAKRSAENGEY